MSNIFLPWILLYLTRVYSPGLKKIFGNEKTFAFHPSIRFMSTRFLFLICMLRKLVVTARD